MHLEHEELGRKYVNSETMFGDDIKDIPRSNFWVSEDGYAWDMEELAQAIEANSGVMRQPLSKHMFSTADVRAIVQHPIGKRLAALSIEQGQMAKGVRRSTIDQLDGLGKTLMADQSSDQLTSRHAIDEFLAYVATLPVAEQQVLDTLRVPAMDSHTNREYDMSIGEAVQDAKGNRVCLHKTGDFIGQAVKYLRSSK
ncbi:hypothetical protein BDY21DRAFT_282503 [Lineolata rhizophorae]|uniref:Uncharacterized protein n=1 Tax=Lineolata rhizophorae TaxID=578093 RepID=A0A6A6P5T7_9PEZI|nr:hypothetical protein BDY21DRAFT_282503 [Lineolata rhizophorae]